jgi:hypothetical protein
MRGACLLTAVVCLVVGGVLKEHKDCTDSGLLGVGFQCFNPREAGFQIDAYPARKQRMQPKPRAYTNRKESRQAKKIRETKARSDLNMGEGGNNKRAYKSNKKPKTKQKMQGSYNNNQKHATMKKKWKSSSSVSGDATTGRFKQTERK